MGEKLKEALEFIDMMDTKAMTIVKNYVIEHLDKSDAQPEFHLYIVWKAKILRNWKYLISTSLLDGMYYEVTFNGDANDWYLDAYKKFQNVPITDEYLDSIMYGGSK